MTPKEKAEELFAKFYNELQSKTVNELFAKQCAIIAVDEMIIQNGELYLKGISQTYFAKKNNYLFEVKEEIEKL